MTVDARTARLRDAVTNRFRVRAGPCPFDNKHSHPYGACPDRVIGPDPEAIADLDAYAAEMRREGYTLALEDIRKLGAEHAETQHRAAILGEGGSERAGDPR